MVCQAKGCTPEEQMLQLLLVTHINREQMATQVLKESEVEAEQEWEWITYGGHDGDGCLSKAQNLLQNPQIKPSTFLSADKRDWTSPPSTRRPSPPPSPPHPLPLDCFTVSNHSGLNGICGWKCLLKEKNKPSTEWRCKKNNPTKEHHHWLHH